MRQVPDVSADADPDTGYVIYWKGTWSEPGYNGGTSAAAPLWAAAAALIDSSPFCADYGSGNAGVQPAGLYSIAALGSPYYGLAFNDITTGNNDFSGSRVTRAACTRRLSATTWRADSGRPASPLGQLLPGTSSSDVPRVPDPARHDRDHERVAGRRPERAAGAGDHHGIGIPSDRRGRPAPGRNGLDHGFLFNKHLMHWRAAC